MQKNDEIILQTLVRLEQKIDLQDSRLDSVDKTLVKQEANLGEHMRRTELAEKNIEAIQQESKSSVNKIQEQLEPIKKHVNYMEGALKGLGVLAAVVAILEGIVKIFGR